MTDYNDGNWHVWSGGDCCPVHPKSDVEAVWHDPRMGNAGTTGPRPAKVENEPTLAWAHVVKFRVVKVHREPRECWGFCNGIYATEAKARQVLGELHAANPTLGFGDMEITHWREVTA